MRNALLELVSSHTPIDPIEQEHTQNTLRFIQENDNCTSAENLQGHVTASAWVLSPDNTATLLTHHRKLNRWLQLGGHVENDSTIQEAAMREAMEESGLSEMNLMYDNVFDIDVHRIPARKGIGEHYHYDIRFLIQANSTVFSKSSESNELAWVQLSRVPELVNDESVLRMCRKCIGEMNDFDGFTDRQ